MSRATTIKLPALDLSSTKSGHPLKSRARSGSIVKVEEVGDRSIDEVLDRGAYVNINADWVNAKGASPTFTSRTRVQPNPSRCVADPRRPHHPWENNHRHYPRNDTTNQLDISELVIPGCMLATFLLLIPWLISLCISTALISYVPLGNRYSLRKRSTWRCIRRFDAMGTN